MTHDELKDKIYWHWRYVQGLDGLQAMTDYRRILIEVIEIHKPMWDGQYCAACHPDQDGSYPCPTIQAVEKELK